MAGIMADALSPLARQWTLLRALSASRHGQTVRKLSHEMTVSEKMIRRDLLLLERVGFPLVETVGDHGRKCWRIAADRQPRLPFTYDELASLYLGRRFIEPLAGTVIWDAAHAPFAKSGPASERTHSAISKNWPRCFTARQSAPATMQADRKSSTI